MPSEPAEETQEDDMAGVAAERKPESAWATGGVIFAATMMIMVGVFQVLEGLAAIIDDEFYVVLPNYAYELDTTAWGWIHLVLGAVVVIAGIYLFRGSTIAGGVAIALALLVAVANFFFIPYYPIWSLLVIALSVFVIWAVTKTMAESRLS